VKFETIKPLTQNYLNSIGFRWHSDIDGSNYIDDTIIVITEDEAQAYYDATNELYEMFITAGEYVMEHELFDELDIPFNLIRAIKKSWEDDHWHLYGRFDLAGGLDGKPIKLIEFNADTPTMLFESSIIQWALLKYNGYNEASQFNTLYEALTDNFKRLILHESSLEAFKQRYKSLNYKILFSSIADNIEEEYTVRLLQHIASEAGYRTDFEFIDKVEFGSEGVFKAKENFEFWFKLIPWEEIALQEPTLNSILSSIIENQKAIILNPPYTLLFQSKGFMKVLWDLFPHHPLLLETSFAPLANKKQVQKSCFGREGANVAIINQDGSIDVQNGGEYANYKPIYQEYVEFLSDSQHNYYQPSTFYAYEACALGFRKGSKIMDNASKFVGHRVLSHL
jgi:glutathionylspermidine synthase